MWLEFPHNIKITPVNLLICRIDKTFSLNKTEDGVVSFISGQRTVPCVTWCYLIESIIGLSILSVIFLSIVL